MSGTKSEVTEVKRRKGSVKRFIIEKKRGKEKWGRDEVELRKGERGEEKDKEAKESRIGDKTGEER